MGPSKIADWMCCQMVQMERRLQSLPSYVPKEPNALPFFLEKKPYQGATGKVYPLPYVDQLSNERVDKAYDMVTMTNEYIQVRLLPELGGKIHGARQLSNGYEFIYENTCIKPAMVGLAGPWVSGGVEFNWPQHHRPTTFSPTEATLQENSDGSKTCWMGEAEPFHRMRGAVGITVYPGSSLVEAKCVLCNRTDTPLPFMWWNNLAVRVHKDYKATFPPDVEWACDHDRRAVISFPVMKGVFHTARPYDYGEGTDASWFSHIKLPTSVMIMRSQSDMGFLGGYDFAANAGTITVSDPLYSVGKKMWTWGDGPFGKAWSANLTDNGDRYIELMTGVYTDNQPDFTYIMPGEVKAFTTVWYPISGIGPAKNATREAALSLSFAGGACQIGCIATRKRNNARVCAAHQGKQFAQAPVDIAPDRPAILAFPLPEGARETEIKISVYAEDGQLLVEYQPTPPGAKKRPQERTIPPRPALVPSLEELYLHGAHLEQYKHHTYRPEDYYSEALRRDPQDLRCNLAMGRLSIEKGDFAAARAHLDKAAARLKMRNDNPADTEALYHLGRLERLEGKDDAAYRRFAEASWQYAWRAPSLFEMACIDSKRGDRHTAIEHLQEALSTNARFVAAHVLLGYFLRDTDRIRQALGISPQDTFARYALYLLGEDEPPAFVRHRAQDVIDAALDFMKAGLMHEAIRVLDTCAVEDPMICYYRTYCTELPAKHASLSLCFPNRLEDIAVLNASSADWQAQYLLGCLYYDRENYAAAEKAWEASKAGNETFAFTHRNLAQLRYDHKRDAPGARQALEEALRLQPENARIVYELLQLYKNMNDSVKARLAFLSLHQEQVAQRDDCYLEQIILLTQDEQYEKAASLLLKKRFTIYEGGEGKLTRHHTWLWTLRGCESMAHGDVETALQRFNAALEYPPNYGEGRHYSAQEANAHYYAGCAQAQAGRMKEARACWRKAIEEPKQITEIRYFAALSHQKLAQPEAARQIFADMVTAGQKRLENADLYDYFGVGGRTPSPFELDPIPINQAEGYMLIALGRHGLCQKAEAEEAVQMWEKIAPYDFRLYAFRKLGQLP